jgi:hypothetical protein
VQGRFGAGLKQSVGFIVKRGTCGGGENTRLDT